MNLPKILEDGKTPAEWVAIFEERGLELSERKLREKARSLNAYCAVGNVMLLKPEHIDLIFEDLSCRLASTKRAGNGGSEAAQTALTVTSTEALEHLTKRLHAPNSGKRKGKRGNVQSLDRMRRQKQTS